jgi:hypothetical protein
MNVTDDSVIDYGIERNHTETDNGRSGRRRSTIHTQQQSKFPL